MAKAVDNGLSVGKVVHQCVARVCPTRLNEHRSWILSDGHAISPNRPRRFGLKTLTWVIILITYVKPNGRQPKLQPRYPIEPAYVFNARQLNRLQAIISDSVTPFMRTARARDRWAAINYINCDLSSVADLASLARQLAAQARDGRSVAIKYWLRNQSIIFVIIVWVYCIDSVACSCIRVTLCARHTEMKTTYLLNCLKWHIYIRRLWRVHRSTATCSVIADLLSASENIFVLSLIPWHY